MRLLSTLPLIAAALTGLVTTASAWEDHYYNSSQVYNYGPAENRTRVHESTTYGPWERVEPGYGQPRPYASSTGQTNITWQDETPAYDNAPRDANRNEYRYHRESSSYSQPETTTWRRVIRKERWWQENQPSVVIVNKYETHVASPKKTYHKPMKKKKKVVTKTTETSSVVKCKCE